MPMSEVRMARTIFVDRPGGTPGKTVRAVIQQNWGVKWL